MKYFSKVALGALFVAAMVSTAKADHAANSFLPYVGGCEYHDGGVFPVYDCLGDVLVSGYQSDEPYQLRHDVSMHNMPEYAVTCYQKKGWDPQTCQVPDKTVECVFTNAFWSGPCTELIQATEAENAGAACTRIQNILNNELDGVSNYCSNTTVRRGWQTARATLIQK
jgi:hypothetical protein